MAQWCKLAEFDARILPAPPLLSIRDCPMHDTDAELMRCANRDDSTAFAELVRRYQGALRRLAESRLGTVEAAEDVVQETSRGLQVAPQL